MFSFIKIQASSLIGVEGGDSCGISGTGETPEGAPAMEEAHRPPHGKRPPGTEINSC
ncbi:multidrug transporter [Sporosarcina pasteurii]|nr:multidrug transporter [Sporosarcina pasteurii]